MKREQVKELLPALTHFANGGNLWYWNQESKIWVKQEQLWIGESVYTIHNIIEDKHFKARKAYALGEEIQYSANNGKATYIDTTLPTWDNLCVYRPKPKEVYEWQWLYPQHGLCNFAITQHKTMEEVLEGCHKFEPSKRLRK